MIGVASTQSCIIDFLVGAQSWLNGSVLYSNL